MTTKALLRAQQEHLQSTLNTGRVVVVEYHTDEEGEHEFRAMHSYTDTKSAEHKHSILNRSGPDRFATIHHPEKTK